MGRAAVLGSLVLLVGGVLVAGILVVADDDSGESESPGETDFGSLLCVDLAGEVSVRSDADELRRLATETVAEAIAEVVKHPSWQATASLPSTASEVTIDPDCPGQPKMDCPEDPRIPPIRCIGSRVSEPSGYLLFVFVVSDADLQRVTGPLTERRSTLEVTCSGDSCQEETSATWVTETELEDGGEMYALVGEGIGILEPRGDEPPASSTETQIAVCVETGASLDADEELAATAAALIEPVLQDVARRPELAGTGRRVDAVSPEVDVKCPREPPVDCPGFTPAIPLIRCPLAENIVTEPGEYNLFIFVVSAEDLAAIQGGETTRRGTVESVCQIDTAGAQPGTFIDSECWPVTGSLYVTDEELEDPEGLTDLLLIGFGLKRED